MFVKNAWYCAGWDYNVSLGRDAIVPRTIAGERLVFYRTPQGRVIGFEDRCPHRQAALSLGRKEGDGLRCMYHGLRFAPDGRCVEVPGRDRIPERACVRTFPVVEKDNWIWVWMGNPARADERLLPDAVGPAAAGWRISTSQMHVKANYRLEIMNLADLSHLTWVHENTVGGSRKYAEIDPEFELFPRGLKTRYWVRVVEPTGAARHLFPSGTLFDMHFDITHTIPCTWVMHFRIFAAGTATSGDSDGALVLDTWTSQAVTPCDADSVDYYYSWGASAATDVPGLSDMLREALDIAFREDATQLEAQHLRVRDGRDHPQVNLPFDEGPAKMIWVLDRLLREEAAMSARAADTDIAATNVATLGSTTLSPGRSR